VLALAASPSIGAAALGEAGPMLDSASRTPAAPSTTVTTRSCSASLARG
jgi:hypothetical protein